MSLNKRLRELISHGYDHAPTLKKLMDGAGVIPADIQSLEDLPKLPITTKDTLAQMQREDPPFGGWLAVKPNTLNRIFVSPGPIFEAESKSEVWDLGAMQAVGIGEDDIVINAFAYHLVSAGLLLDSAARGVGATVVPTGPGNTEYQVQIMMTLGASGYTGTPSFLKIIFEKAEAMGIARQDMPIKKAVFSAEPYPPSLRTFFEQECGMVTSSAYATAELGVIAYDWTGHPTLKVSNNVIIEIADPETGQPVTPGTPGHVVVTRFNPTYPLVRFGLGDLSAHVGEPDDEGYYRYIKGWLGRVGDAIKVRGMFLHPLQMKAALGKFEALGNAQAIVTRPETRDHVELRVELKDRALQDSAAIDQDGLREDIKAAVSQTCRLRINVVNFMEAGSIDSSARTVVDERSWE